MAQAGLEIMILLTQLATNAELRRQASQFYEAHLSHTTLHPVPHFKISLSAVGDSQRLPKAKFNSVAVISSEREDGTPSVWQIQGSDRGQRMR